MAFRHKTIIILIGLLSSLTPLTLSKMNSYMENNNALGDDVADLSDDEISYALSELSIDDLNTLSKLIDVLSQEGEIGEENYGNSHESSEELTRFKRESSDTSAKNNQEKLIPNVDEEYIRQLEDSFPNVIDRPNREEEEEEKEKPHIRVKRD